MMNQQSRPRGNRAITPPSLPRAPNSLAPNQNLPQQSDFLSREFVLVVRARNNMSLKHVVQALHRFHVTAAYCFSTQFPNAHRAGRTHCALA